MYYQFDSSGRLIAEVDTPGLMRTNIAPPSNSAGVGNEWLFVDGLKKWMAFPVQVEVAAPDNRPVLLLTGIESTADGVLIDHEAREVTCPVGAVVTFLAELRDPTGHAVLPLSATFRMPMSASDGRERVLLAAMQSGVVTVRITFSESGIWSVDEAGINSALPPESQMRFDGFKAFVVQT